MKKVSLLLFTMLTATMLVACSDDKGGGVVAPTPIVPGGTPTPPTTSNDGFITWQSEAWNGNVTNSTRFSELLSYAFTPGASQAICGVNGYYPTGGYFFNIMPQYQMNGGRRYFYGDYNCESYTRASFIIFRYNPETKKARLYVYGKSNNNYSVIYSRETTESNQATGFFADFGPLFTNGNTPDHISSFRVYVSSPATSHGVTNLPIEVRFGPAPTGDVVTTDNLIRVN